MKAETASPPRTSIRPQQAAFDQFQQTYNKERPHEALGMKAPAEVHELSPRQLPLDPPPHTYGDGVEQRSVRPDGAIKWAGSQVFVGEAFASEIVGLTAVDEGRWRPARRHDRPRPLVQHAESKLAGNRCHPCARSRCRVSFRSHASPWRPEATPARPARFGPKPHLVAPLLDCSSARTARLPALPLDEAAVTVTQCPDTSVTHVPRCTQCRCSQQPSDITRECAVVGGIARASRDAAMSCDPGPAAGRAPMTRSHIAGPTTSAAPTKAANDTCPGHVLPRILGDQLLTYWNQALAKVAKSSGRERIRHVNSF